jgi:hypothetical protein
MGTISLRSSFVAEIGGRRRFGGAEGEVVAITCGSDAVDDREFSIAQNTTKTLWDATASPCTDFDFLWIESDVEVLLELITDQNNGTGKQSYTATVTPGVPFILASDQSYANYTTNFAAGTLDVIDKILCRNLEEDTATVRIFVAT